jgi:hypothetical protein
MIEKKKIYIPYTRVIKPAHYQEIDTGNFQEVSIFDSNGVERKEQRKIINKVFIEAVTEEALEERTAFIVVIDGEEHQFSSEKDAKEFLK